MRTSRASILGPTHRCVAALAAALALAACGGPEDMPRGGEIESTEDALEAVPAVPSAGLAIPSVGPVRPPLASVVFMSPGTEGCGIGNEIAPAEGEDGEWLAARLTPPKFPAIVTQVGYSLTNHAPKPGFPWTCRTNLAHQVKVWKQAAATPANTPPADAQTIAIAANGSTAAVVPYTVNLPSSIRVNAGESLFVAVQTAGAVPTTTCFAACGIDEPEPEELFWSFTTAVPFAWGDLTGWGLHSVPFWARAY